MADFSKRIEKAEKYLQKGKTESALEEYLGILEDDPNQDAVRSTAADLWAGGPPFTGQHPRGCPIPSRQRRVG